MAVIINSTENTLISGTSDDDSIYNHHNEAVIIISGSGNDSITNYYGNNVSINGGAGNDYIDNNYKNVTISGGDGDDTVLHRWGPNTSISGGAGNDSIYNIGGYSPITINGDEGNDTIYNGANNASISGGTGNDILSNSFGENILFKYANGDGFDTIYGFNETSTLRIGNGTTDTYSTVKSGNDIIVKVGEGSITLSGAASLSTVNIAGTIGGESISNSNSNSVISGTSYNDTIYNTGSNISISGNAGSDSIKNWGSYSDPVVGSKVTIDGGAGNDYIENMGNYVTINAGTGNDTITINAWTNGAPGGFYSSVEAGDGNDSIRNFSNYVTLNGGSGNDSIVSGYSSLIGNNVTINAGAGNDLISLVSPAKNHLIQYKSGDGNDTIYGFNATSTLRIGNGTTDTYSTVKSGNNVIVTVGTGKITLVGAASLSSVNILPTVKPNPFTEGNDTYSNSVSSVLLNALGGNDSVCNYGSKVTIIGGAGNDTVLDFGASVSIDTGLGKDSVGINSAASNVTMKTGSGNDSVNNWGKNSYIDTQEDNDYIYNSSLSTNSTILTDYGSDTISNYASSVKAYAGAGDDSIYNRQGDHITLSGGDGSDTINNAFSETVSIAGGAGNDSIYGNNNYATVSGGTGQDTISGNHWRSKLSGDGDNDLISITTYWYNTIDGGDGNDTIIAGGSEHSVNGGAGADKISLSGDKLTVKGGKGNDTIYGNTMTSHLYQYTSSDGNDPIYNWSSNDTLTITGGSYSYRTIGDNVIVTVGNGSISLMGAADKAVNINGKVIKTSPDVIITPQDVIKKFMLSLDKSTLSASTTSSVATVMLNNAIKAASNSKYTTIQQVINKMVADCKSYDGDWKRFLKEKCDIDLDNEDTGAITGYDAGGSATQKGASDIVPESGSVDKSFTGSYFYLNGLNVYLGDGKTFYGLSKEERYIWQALRSWWLPSVLNLIAESYGDNFSFTNKSSSTIDNNRLYVSFYNNSKDTAPLASVSVLNNSQGIWRDGYGNIVGSLRLNINMRYYNGIVVDNLDGASSETSSLLDRTLAHEFTHAVMDANIRYATDKPGLPQFIKDGMSELTHGIDDNRNRHFKTYAMDYLSLEDALDMERIYDESEDIDVLQRGYVGGYMFMRYIAKQFSSYATDGEGYSEKTVADKTFLPEGLTRDGALLTASSTFKGNAIDLTDYTAVTKVNATALSQGVEITGTTLNDSIKSGKGADTIFGGMGKDSLWGGAGDDVFYGGSGNDKLYGEAGNDTIYAGIGNDTLTGGTGKDIFAHEGGKDVIADYTAGDDKIKILSGSITNASVSGANVVFKTEDGSITVKNGKDKTITVIDSEGNEATTIVLANDSKAAITLPTSISSAYASARTAAIRIVGNAKDNTIVGGTKNDTLYGKDSNDYLIGNAGADKLYGQNGNDTLWGGAGNDTLIGGTGSDVFIYNAGDGKDVITDFIAKDDMLQITGAFSATYYKSSNKISFKVGSTASALTLKDINVTSATTFDINGDMYKISGSKLIKK